ncbi:NACHT domain-containing protein [Actinoplanes solisilvae]|uniref:NACHT domain-containing protein n=1 Tax=Actinoplanes solisilvae TaxID=2486853 RepID=UPI0013E33C85|nr:NACHT domain-containing protein [Actinoplanes solisilvae]
MTDERPRPQSSTSASETGSIDLTGLRGANVAVSGVVHGAITVLSFAGPPITLAAVLGPAIIVPLQWQAVVADQVGAVALLAGYWLVLAALRMTLEIASRRFDSVSAAADGILGRSISRYHHHYRAWVVRRNRYPQSSRPLPTTGAVSPELDDIFVDVSVVPRPTHLVTSGLLDDAPTGVTDRQSIWQFLNRRRAETLILLGAPGSGKSTLLRHIARRIANRPPLPGRRWVPVLLELRTHAHLILADRTITLPDLVTAAMRGLPVAEPPGWWRGKLRRGLCVVLFDGLDEVPSMQDRAAIVDWLRRQATDYPGNHFLITSRPYGFDRLRADEFKTLQARPFTETQVGEFIGKWYLATERVEGPDKRSADARAATGATDLVERLTTTPALHDLMVNPLLLTMIANVHRHRKTLPENRVRLYTEVFEVLLGPRAEDDPQEASRHAEQVQDELSYVAFEFMRAGALQLRRDEMPDLPQAIETGKRNGILVELDHDVFAFAHLTFQEYLTACHVRHHKRVDVLIAGISTTWWRETILLWAGAQSADEVVVACLEAGGVGALSLAVECTDLDDAVHPSLRRRLQFKIDEAYADGAGDEHRRVVAGVEALRYVRRSVLTPGGSRLCVGPVPARLHWLFRRLEHEDPGPAPAADVPAYGLGGREVLAFVDWLNRMISGGDPDTSYRLATAAELDTLAGRGDDLAADLRRTSPAVWVAGRRSDLPRLWTAPGTPSPAVVSGSEMGGYLRGIFVSPALLLDVLSVGLRARAALTLTAIVNVADLARQNSDYIVLLASRPYVTFRTPGNRVTGRAEVVYTEPVKGKHPFREDAETARQNLEVILQLQDAISVLADVIGEERDIGGDASIAGMANAIRADLVLADLHRRCGELESIADVWRRSTLQSLRDINRIREQTDVVSKSCSYLLHKAEMATKSFRRVRLDTGRPWRSAADYLDDGLWTVSGRDPGALFHSLLQLTIGQHLESARTTALTNRKPEDADRVLTDFTHNLVALAGLRENHTIEAYVDQVREGLPGLIRRSMDLPGALRPLVEGLRGAGERAFAPSGGSTDDHREARVMALGLAACAWPNEDYLSVVAATLMLERRAQNTAREVIHLAST